MERGTMCHAGSESKTLKMKPPQVYRSIVNAKVSNADILYQSWHQDLNLSQQSILIEAGILPFVKAVTYRTDNALCAALIDFMVDAELTVGQRKIQITEEEIHEATRLPNSGRDVSPSTDYDGFKIITSLTKSQRDASVSQLMLDDIVDPVVQYVSKFLIYKVLGYIQKPDYIPFKYVETAIDVAHGIRFNWCKFIKNRMLQQIELIHREHKGIFAYPTILQFMAFRAFNNNCIPRNVIREGEAYINAYNICGRNVAKTAEEKRIVNQGISCMIGHILKEHEYRVVTGSPLKKTEINTNKQKRKTVQGIHLVYKGGGCKKARTRSRNPKMFLGSTIIQKSPSESEVSANELPSPLKSHIDKLSKVLPGLSNDIKESDCKIIDNNSMLLASPQPSESESACLFKSCDKKSKFNDHITKQSFYGQEEDLKAIKSNSEGTRGSLCVKQEMEVCMLSHQQPAQQQEQQKDKELQSLRIENSRLSSEKLHWELEKAMLEAQKMTLIDENAHVWQENEQLEIENSCLQAQLLEKVQLSAELRRKLDKMKKFWGCND